MESSVMKLLTQLNSIQPDSGIPVESTTWLVDNGGLPIWSRRSHPMRIEEYKRNRMINGKWHSYEVELPETLWSLWGGLHPKAPWFDKVVQGRQYLACCVMACCVASYYKRFADWNGKLLDAIVVNGDKYYRDCIEKNERWDLKLTMKDLNEQCLFENIKFLVHHEQVACGLLYSEPPCALLNLSEAMNFFFTRYQNGIIICQHRFLAFGYSATHDGGYFLFDCQEWDKPIFPPNMGAAYLLRTKQLQTLIYCIVVTLNVRKSNVKFELHNVEAQHMSTVAEDEEDD